MVLLFFPGRNKEPVQKSGSRTALSPQHKTGLPTARPESGQAY